MKAVKFENLGFYFERRPKSSNVTNSKKNVDYENYVYRPLLKQNYIQHENIPGVDISAPIILNSASSAKELAQRFHEVFTPAVQAKYIQFQYLRFLPIGFSIKLGNNISYINPNKDSDFLTNKKLTALARNNEGFSNKNLEDLENQIYDKEREIIRLQINANTSGSQYELSLSEIKLITEEKTRLRKEKVELLSKSEEDLASEVLNLARRINKDIKKMNLDELEEYQVNYANLEKNIKRRLIAEEKIKEDSDWSLKSTTPVKDESKDNILQYKSELVTAEKAREKLWNEKLQTPLATIFTKYARHVKGDEDKFLEE